MEVDSDRDWTVVGWCWFGHKTAHPTTSILPHSRARSARRSRRNHAFMSADPNSDLWCDRSAEGLVMRSTSLFGVFLFDAIA
jgi:hypothetical protein